MNINLPNDLESSIRAEVARGHFASVDDAMAEAARLLLRELRLGHPTPSPAVEVAPRDAPLGSIGAMSEDAALLDEIVADAYRRRSQEPWREFDP
jgi:Arc/MetJ-type ribon-helix-helix transcriptional regulator